MDIRFLGQACVELSDGPATVVVDPFLKPNNPLAPVTADEVEATHILITHGHADHLADAVTLANRTGAPCVAIVEVANWLGEQGVEETYDPNFGGTISFDWGSVKLVPAWHTNTLPGSEEAPYSPTTGTVVGLSTGLIIEIGGKTIYHTGDTCLFGDMKLIADRAGGIDVALMPIGGHYTMDRHDAVVAAELIGAQIVIPIHYDTFPPIETDSEAFKSDVESKTSSKVVLLKPGESHSP